MVLDNDFNTPCQSSHDDGEQFSKNSDLYQNTRKTVQSNKGTKRTRHDSGTTHNTSTTTSSFGSAFQNRQQFNEMHFC